MLQSRSTSDDFGEVTLFKNLCTHHKALLFTIKKKNGTYCSRFDLEFKSQAEASGVKQTLCTKIDLRQDV